MIRSRSDACELVNRRTAAAHHRLDGVLLLLDGFAISIANERAHARFSEIIHDPLVLLGDTVAPATPATDLDATATAERCDRFALSERKLRQIHRHLAGLKLGLPDARSFEEAVVSPTDSVRNDCERIAAVLGLLAGGERRPGRRGFPHLQLETVDSRRDGSGRDVQFFRDPVRDPAKTDLIAATAARPGTTSLFARIRYDTGIPATLAGPELRKAIDDHVKPANVPF